MFFYFFIFFSSLLFCHQTGYVQGPSATKEELNVQNSADITLKRGTLVTVQLATPTIVRKVTVRQPSPTGIDLKCLAKVVKFHFPDGTTAEVKFEGDKDEDQYLAAPRGDWGGEYAYADVKPVSKLFGLPVIESYDVEVVVTQGKCASGETMLRGVEVRG